MSKVLVWGLLAVVLSGLTASVVLAPASGVTSPKARTSYTTADSLPAAVSKTNGAQEIPRAVRHSAAGGAQPIRAVARATAEASRSAPAADPVTLIPPAVPGVSDPLSESLRLRTPDISEFVTLIPAGTPAARLPAVRLGFELLTASKALDRVVGEAAAAGVPQLTVLAAVARSFAVGRAMVPLDGRRWLMVGYYSARIVNRFGIEGVGAPNNSCSTGCWHVRTDGNNSNTCTGNTAGTACATPAGVHAKAGLGAGDTIIVHSGTYSGKFTLSKSGTSGSPIVLESINPESTVVFTATMSTTPPCGVTSPTEERTITLDAADYWVIRDFSKINNGISIQTKNANALNSQTPGVGACPGAYSRSDACWEDDRVPGMRLTGPDSATVVGLIQVDSMRVGGGTSTTSDDGLRVCRGLSAGSGSCPDPADGNQILNNHIETRGIITGTARFSRIVGNDIGPNVCGVAPGVHVAAMSMANWIYGNHIHDLAGDNSGAGATHFLNECIRRNGGSWFNDVRQNICEHMLGAGKAITHDVHSGAAQIDSNTVRDSDTNLSDQDGGRFSVWAYNVSEDTRGEHIGQFGKGGGRSTVDDHFPWNLTWICNKFVGPSGGGGPEVVIGGGRGGTYLNNGPASGTFLVSLGPTLDGSGWGALGNLWDGGATAPPEKPNKATSHFSLCAPPPPPPPPGTRYASQLDVWLPFEDTTAAGLHPDSTGSGKLAPDSSSFSKPDPQIAGEAPGAMGRSKSLAITDSTFVFLYPNNTTVSGVAGSRKFPAAVSAYRSRMTVGAWYLPVAISLNHHLVGRWSLSGGVILKRWQLQHNSANTLAFRYFSGGAQQSCTQANAVGSPPQWEFWAATADSVRIGGADSLQVKLYRRRFASGVLDATTTLLKTCTLAWPMDTSSVNASLTVGASEDMDWQAKGNFDEVFTDGVALSQTSLDSISGSGIFGAVGANSPAKPTLTVTYPPTSGVLTSATLTGSAFSDADGSGTFQSARFQAYNVKQLTTPCSGGAYPLCAQIRETIRTATSMTMGGLEEGAQVQFRVAYKDTTNLESSFSDTSGSTGIHVQVLPPSVLTASLNGATSASVTWTHNSGRTDVADTLEMSSNGGVTWTKPAGGGLAVGGVPPVTIGGLTVGTTYQFRAKTYAPSTTRINPDSSSASNTFELTVAPFGPTDSLRLALWMDSTGARLGADSSGAGNHGVPYHVVTGPGKYAGLGGPASGTFTILGANDTSRITVRRDGANPIQPTTKVTYSVIVKRSATAPLASIGLVGIPGAAELVLVPSGSALRPRLDLNGLAISATGTVDVPADNIARRYTAIYDGDKVQFWMCLGTTPSTAMDLGLVDIANVGINAGTDSLWVGARRNGGAPGGWDLQTEGYEDEVMEWKDRAPTAADVQSLCTLGGPGFVRGSVPNRPPNPAVSGGTSGIGSVSAVLNGIGFYDPDGDALGRACWDVYRSLSEASILSACALPTGSGLAPTFTPSFTVSDLEPESKYYWTVAYEDAPASARGLPSAPDSFVTLAPPPPPAVLASLVYPTAQRVFRYRDRPQTQNLEPYTSYQVLLSLAEELAASGGDQLIFDPTAVTAKSSSGADVTNRVVQQVALNPAGNAYAVTLMGDTTLTGFVRLQALLRTASGQTYQHQLNLQIRRPDPLPRLLCRVVEQCRVEVNFANGMSAGSIGSAQIRIWNPDGTRNTDAEARATAAPDPLAAGGGRVQFWLEPAASAGTWTVRVRVVTSVGEQFEEYFYATRK